MTDLTMTIEPKSDQLNADDLIVGPKTLTVSGVKLLSGDQPVSIHYEGDNGKPFKPCKSMRRVLVSIWGSDGNNYVGRQMTVYCDPDVTFGKNKVGGIRISHMSHIEHSVTMALTASRARRKPYTVEPIVMAVDNTKEEGDEAATHGTEVLRQFWGGLSIAQKNQHKGNLEQWKEIATAADVGE